MSGNDNEGAWLAVRLGVAMSLLVSLLCRCCRSGRARGGELPPPPAAADSVATGSLAIPLSPPPPRLNPQPATAPADALPPAYSQVVLGAKQPPYNMNAPH